MLKKLSNHQRRWRLRDIWLMLGIVLLGLWMMFLIVSTVTMWNMDQQSTKTLQGVLESGASRLDDRLNQIEKFIKVLLISDDNFTSLRNTSINRANNLRHVSIKLEENGQYFSEFSGIFYYEPYSELLIEKRWNDFATYSYYDVPRKMKMRELMMELSSGKGTDDKWVLENVNEVWTAFYIYYYEGQYLGVYISLEGILRRIVGLEDVDGFENMLLVSETGEKLTGNEDKQRTIEKNMYGKTYLQLEEKLQILPATMIALISRQRARGSWMTWWITLLVLAIFSGQFLVYLLRTLQKTLFGPLAELNCKMKIFSEGNLETRIEERVGCQEVRELTDTFNEMTGQIRNMKIENYEKKLEMQETILKYLQIQKNPHFFLNVLNGIYSLATSGNMLQVRTITLELIKHVRYVLSVEKILVPLLEELEFTQNYVKIQKIRFPYEIRLEINGITEEAGRVRVPPLLIQTFLENAIKYALSPENILEVHLQVELTRTHLKLCISDSGPGYPERILQELNTGGNVLTDERGEHIGIHNVLSRIRLLYQEGYTYYFSNPSSGGAQVEFMLPRNV